MLGIVPESIRVFLMSFVQTASSYIESIQNMSFIEPATTWISRFRFLILPTLIYSIHKLVLRMHLNRLKKLTMKLHTLVLHWQLCMTAMTSRNRCVCVCMFYVFGICFPFFFFGWQNSQKAVPFCPQKS